MMLEDQLRKHMNLNKIGAYGINKGTKDIVEGINYSAHLLQNPRNLVIMFPQGAFTSLYHYPVKFEKGIMRIIEKAGDAYEIVFMAALIDYFSSKKPVLTLSLKKTDRKEIISFESLENGFNEHLLNSIAAQREDML
jgi:hypothetical protein